MSNSATLRHLLLFTGTTCLVCWGAAWQMPVSDRAIHCQNGPRHSLGADTTRLILSSCDSQREGKTISRTDYFSSASHHAWNIYAALSWVTNHQCHHTQTASAEHTHTHPNEQFGGKWSLNCSNIFSSQVSLSQVVHQSSQNHAVTCADPMY